MSLKFNLKSMLVVLIIASLLNTAYAATITNDQLIISKCGGLCDILNVGDRLHLYTYSDGTQDYKLIRPTDAAKTGLSLFENNIQSRSNLLSPITRKSSSTFS